MRRTAVLVVAAALLGLPVGPAAASGERARVLAWVDGDTVRTTAGVVRLIGVDAPESGTCGAQKALRVARRSAPVGSTVRLVAPSSVDDRDGYGRALRYVDRGRVDVALRLLRAGVPARFDSRDGYDAHPRQARYRAADAAHPDLCVVAPPPGTDLASYPPVAGTRDCPPYAPIKGNRDSMIYHLPGDRYYGVTTPEECFATEAGAQAAGYRRAQV